ncbi:dipeptide ABC transporter ATP-binding protein [Treponema zuelzerae]|uniref:Dipeptide ABC transporter ATP-binding protein n=1 Tax=Teretinema zuelzerae TaxID=156 RepID=A0AAE3EFQ4_9SPIR|nr:dipeptide ABC transporter ATP-binding protein [Teretinema zuelzerae]MCD1654020.1 dipeptide ABC transporter ATP-binding protein [Teretinema zuelzerae]
MTDSMQNGGIAVNAAAPLLEVSSLRIAFKSRDRIREVVYGVDFSISANETLALVGESGSGKTVSAQSILRLLPSASASYPGGKILFRGRDILSAGEDELRSLRGREIGMVFQEPMSSLNPLHTVEQQIGETLFLHRGLSRSQARPVTLQWLDRVGLAEPEKKFRSYPHQLSGGERQRVMIAMALANEPALLIADEPTTALDVTVQAQILDLLLQLQRELGMAMLFITHNLEIVSRVADRVAVMQDGLIVETGPVEKVFTSPEHPYTKRLLSADPEAAGIEGSPAVGDSAQSVGDGAQSVGNSAHLADGAQSHGAAETPDGAAPPTDGTQTPAGAQTTDGAKSVGGGAALAGESSGVPVLEGRGIKVWFPVQKGFLRRSAEWIKAVDGVDAVLYPGETLGIAGESGSGKTTLGKALLKLTASSGEIRLGGIRIDELEGAPLRLLRRRMQIIFQDPFGSLNPRMTVADIIAEGLEAHGMKDRTERDALVCETLREVGLDPEIRFRYPHEYSGGQRQRIAIARALVLKPEVIVLDEPTSSLDRTVQFQVIALLRDIQRKHGLSYIFISHDLKVLRALSHRLMIMKAGRVVEQGLSSEVFANPKDAYTRNLISTAFGLS